MSIARTMTGSNTFWTHRSVRRGTHYLDLERREELERERRQQVDRKRGAQEVLHRLLPIGDQQIGTVEGSAARQPQQPPPPPPPLLQSVLS